MVDRNEDGLLSFGEMADIFHSARAREVKEIQLRPGLAGLSVSDLRARAERDGVDRAVIEAAANSDAPEAGLIRLISIVAELPLCAMPAMVCRQVTLSLVALLVDADRRLG